MDEKGKELIARYESIRSHVPYKHYGAGTSCDYLPAKG